MNNLGSVFIIKLIVEDINTAEWLVYANNVEEARTCVASMELAARTASNPGTIQYPDDRFTDTNKSTCSEVTPITINALGRAKFEYNGNHYTLVKNFARRVQ